MRHLPSRVNDNFPLRKLLWSFKDFKNSKYLESSKLKIQEAPNPLIIKLINPISLTWLKGLRPLEERAATVHFPHKALTKKMNL